MNIEFDEEQKSSSSGDIDCEDLKCEWNINGICTCPGLLPCIDLE
jgi:hypothetical protein